MHNVEFKIKQNNIELTSICRDSRRQNNSHMKTKTAKC